MSAPPAIPPRHDLDDAGRAPYRDR